MKKEQHDGQVMVAEKIHVLCGWCNCRLHDGGVEQEQKDGTVIRFCDDECRADFNRPRPLYVNVGGTDWEKFRGWKRAIHLMTMTDTSLHTIEKANLGREMSGLLGFLDNIQESAAQIAGAKIIYGNERNPSPVG